MQPSYEYFETKELSGSQKRKMSKAKRRGILFLVATGSLLYFLGLHVHDGQPTKLDIIYSLWFGTGILAMALIVSVPHIAPRFTNWVVQWNKIVKGIATGVCLVASFLVGFAVTMTGATSFLDSDRSPYGYAFPALGVFLAGAWIMFIFFGLIALMNIEGPEEV